MVPPLPQPPEPGGTAPGTVQATLSGAAPDLARLGIFLQAVTDGRDPASVIADLHLAAITITAMRGTRGRGDRLTVMFQLDE